MKRFIVSLCSCACLLIAAVGAPAQPALRASRNIQGGDAYRNPERFLVDEFVVEFKEGPRRNIRIEKDTAGVLKSNIASIDAAIAQSKVTQFERQFPTAKPQAVMSRHPDLTGYYTVKIEKEADLDAAMAAFASDPNVDHVEKIGVHELLAAPNDGFYGDQWHMRGPFGIDAETAWDTEDGDPSVIVGILDSGVRYFHQDLGGPNAVWSPASPQTNGNVFVNTAEIPNNASDDDNNGRTDDTVGFDFLTNSAAAGCTCIDADCSGADNDPDDFNGHGTHMAGLAGGITNNLRGIAGAAGGFSAGPAGSSGNGIKILPLRMGWHANCAGSGVTGLVSMSAAAAAMNYVADMVDAGHNIVAVNCSWGSSNTGGLGAAAAALLSRDVMIVVAAGNSGTPFPSFLGSIPEVVAVGGTDIAGNGYVSSEFGPWVDIAAPAVNIRSTYRNPADANPNNHYYAIFPQGTSMSAPHVCGVAALLESCRPSLTSQEKLDIMLRTSIPYSDPRDLGDGIVNAANAVVSCGQDQKAIQRPSDDGEAVASSIDWSDNDPNRIIADDFVSDGRPITSVRWWGSEVTDTPPYHLDDGVAEDAIGVNDGAGTGGTFGWANQFQNNTGGAITLTRIEVAFGSPGGATGVSVGDAVDAVIWVDAAATGNMANAAPLIRWTLIGGVHANDGNTFASHPIPGGAVIPAGAEFYVGCGDIQTQNDATVRFPASIDQTATQGRSWAFFPPGIADPFDENLAGQTLGTIDSFGLPGNWLIRAFGDAAEVPDGWYITFHESLATGGSAEVPLGLYYCDEPIVVQFPTSLGSCDGRFVTEYTADLADCCLIHANPDSRDSLTPATPTAFNEVECFEYGLGIQATIGSEWTDPGGGCVETSTGRSATEPFWGWESTSNEIGDAYGLLPAVESIVSMSGPDWLYGPWSTFALPCSAPNMAFALFTTTNPGTINDANGTGVPDVCECLAPAPVIDEPSPVAKNRYLSFEPQAGGIDTAIRVTITASANFPGSVGEAYWVGPHNTTCSDCNGTPFTDASLQCTQHCQDWGGLGVIHAHGPEVVPDTTYEVEVIDCLCDPGDPLNFSAPLVMTTQKWGDLIAPFGGGAQPNFADVTALVDTFKCIGLELPTVRAQLQANAPNPCINPNFADITADVDAFKGDPYPFAGPVSCP